MCDKFNKQTTKIMGNKIKCKNSEIQVIVKNDWIYCKNMSYNKKIYDQRYEIDYLQCNILSVETLASVKSIE